LWLMLKMAENTKNVTMSTFVLWKLFGKKHQRSHRQNFEDISE
jgi:hypothetical protein